LEWSPKDVIDLTLISMYKYTDNLLVRINCELLTPFDNWRRTSISGGYEIANSVQQLLVVIWQTQMFYHFGLQATSPEIFSYMI
jgi:hypothetical protein